MGFSLEHYFIVFLHLPFTRKKPEMRWDLNIGVCVCTFYYVYNTHSSDIITLLSKALVISLFGSSNKSGSNVPLPTFPGAPSHSSVLNIAIQRGLP